MRGKSVLLPVVLFMTIGLCGTVLAQEQPTVHTVQSVANKTATVEGSLKDGVKLKSLAWASMSSNACFPATQNAKFTGNHVFFVTELPPHSIMTVTVKPKNGSTDLSIYGYQIAPNRIILPEDLRSCVSCEADHKWDYPKRGQTQTSARSIRFNAIGNSYKVFIGIAGANGLTEGDFTLEVTLKQ
jgi:hypothetical protein